MTVRTDEGFAGLAEPFQMYLMTDAVARTGEIQAVLLRYGLDEPVVIRILEAGLEGIMVDICYGQFRLHPRYTHGLEFQISHGAGRILCQSLVYLQSDFAAHGHVTAD